MTNKKTEPKKRKTYAISYDESLMLSELAITASRIIGKTVTKQEILEALVRKLYDDAKMFEKITKEYEANK